jgi:hypothetical protein
MKGSIEEGKEERNDEGRLAEKEGFRQNYWQDGIRVRMKDGDGGRVEWRIVKEWKRGRDKKKLCIR